MENILIKYCKKNNVDYLILRLPGVVGNFQGDVNFINLVIKNFTQIKLLNIKIQNVTLIMLCIQKLLQK